MNGMLTVARAEFLYLEAIRGIAPILPRDVVTLLALSAGKGDLRANVA